MTNPTAGARQTALIDAIMGLVEPVLSERIEEDLAAARRDGMAEALDAVRRALGDANPAVQVLEDLLDSAGNGQSYAA